MKRPLLAKGERINGIAVAYSDGATVPHKRGWWVLVRKGSGEIVAIAGPLLTEHDADKVVTMFQRDYMDTLH